MWVIKVYLFLCVGARTHSHDLRVAAGTGRGEELSVTVLTVNIILFLHKTDISQRCVAIMAVKLLWVPRAAQRHQEGPPTPEKWLKKKKEVILKRKHTKLIVWISCICFFTPDDVVAGTTHRCPVAGSKTLCSLCNPTSYRWKRGRDKGGWGRARGSRGRRRVGHVGRRWWGSSGQRLHFDTSGGLTGVKLLGKIVIHHPRGSVGGLCRAGSKRRWCRRGNLNQGRRRDMYWGRRREINWGRMRECSRNGSRGLNRGFQKKREILEHL